MNKVIHHWICCITTANHNTILEIMLTGNNLVKYKSKDSDGIIRDYMQDKTDFEKVNNIKLNDYF